jgi:hypothetical protein
MLQMNCMRQFAGAGQRRIVGARPAQTETAPGNAAGGDVEIIQYR